MPKIIAISETKLNDYNTQNLTIPGYQFINNNSSTNAGGVGLYIDENIEFHRRSDLETCFIELHRQKQKNLVVGCIYRHPNGNKLDRFQDMLSLKLESH